MLALGCTDSPSGGTPTDRLNQGPCFHLRDPHLLHLFLRVADCEEKEPFRLEVPVMHLILRGRR